MGSKASVKMLGIRMQSFILPRSEIFETILMIAINEDGKVTDDFLKKILSPFFFTNSLFSN